jgi:hypothetical protein
MDDTSKTLIVFPDTNVLVQCKPLSELDWGSIWAPQPNHSNHSSPRHGLD